MYPPFMIDADIFSNDESDYEDYKSGGTDFQVAVDDSEYDPEEDDHGQNTSMLLFRNKILTQRSPNVTQLIPAQAILSLPSTKMT